MYTVCTLCLSHTYTVPRDTCTCVLQNCGLGLGLGFDQCLLLPLKDHHPSSITVSAKVACLGVGPRFYLIVASRGTPRVRRQERLPSQHGVTWRTVFIRKAFLHHHRTRIRIGRTIRLQGSGEGWRTVVCTDAVFSDAQLQFTFRLCRSAALSVVMSIDTLATSVGSLAGHWRSLGRLDMGPGRADGCRVHKVTEYVLQLLAQGGVPWPLLLLLLLALVRLGAATLMFVQRLQLLLRRRLRRRPLSRRCC